MMNIKWMPTKLDDVLRQVKRTQAVISTEDYPLLGIRLDGGGPFLREKKQGSQISSSKVFQVKAGDFVYSRLFAWRGAFGVVKDVLDGCFVSNEFPTFVPIDNNIDVNFLSYWFRLPRVLRMVEADCTGSTPLTRNRFKEEFFLQLEFPLPPLSEQRRIVGRIKKLAAKIEEAYSLRERSVIRTDTLFHSCSRHAFEAITSYEIVSLGDVCSNIIDCLHSNPIYSDDGIPTVRSPDVGWGKLFFENALKTTEEEYRRRTQRGKPLPGDIVLVREGGGTGKAGIVEEGQRLSLGQRVMQLRPDANKVLPRFLLYQWLSPLIQQDQIAEQMKGSASPHLNIGVLTRFKFILTSLDEQNHIVSYLDNAQAKMDRLEALQTQTATKLNSLLPSILDKAFRGEL